ncbi:g10819 [Coccomyxa elongata]
MGTQQASILQDNLPGLQAPVLSSKGLTGSQSPLPEPLNVKSDLTRLGVGDENRSPNDKSFRETTPDINLGISLVNKPLESPYSPHSNPFGKRPSQRTPGALAFVRRLSELKSPSAEAELDPMGGEDRGVEEASAWQPSPEVSAEDVQSSWDAVGRMGENLGESAHSPLPKLPNLAAVQEASHLAELAESELALTWTGPRIVTEEAPSSWRKRISNPTFHGTPSPTSSRASSASEPLLNAAGFSGLVFAARGSPTAVDSGVSSPFRTPRGPPHHPQAAQRQVSPPTEEALRSSAEVFPRSFRIQRTGSSDSLASLLSMTSDITARESSFEAAREASALETILEPGETPERRRESLGYFQSAGANPAQLVLGDVLPVPRPEGPETPRAQVLRVEGAFASPIEVQAAHGPSVMPPMALDQASEPEVNAAAASAWLQQQSAATPFAQLRQPSSLTPVIRAQAAHAQTTTRDQHGSLRGRALAWSTLLLALQLLLILAPFVLILCAPVLLPNLPKLGSHPTAFPKASSLTSAATYPGMTGGRGGGPSWWAQPWAPPLGHFSGGRGAAKSPSGPLNTAVDFFHRLFRQETPQTTHAFFGLLPKASHAAPTPHLDKLLFGAASWWSGVTGKLARPAAAKQPPRRIPQPRAMTAADAGPKTPAHRTPAQQSLERAQHLKPKVSAAPPATPAPAQTPPAAAAKQVTPKAAPSMEHKQPHPLPAEPAVQHEAPGAPELKKATQQGIGTQPRHLAKSALRAVQRLKHSAADATEELLLRSRALLPRGLSSLPRFLQAHGQGITAAVAITVLVGILFALVAAAAAAPKFEEPPSDGVLAPSTPAASVPPATAGPIFEAPKTTSRRGRRPAAAEGTPAQMRRAPRQAPAASMPPPATPKATAGRAARTAPVSAGLAPERLTSTADTPALRTRARTRRTVN